MRSIGGNAFFITLICVVLLGAVTFVVSRQMSSGSAQTISAENYELFADKMINYVNTAQLVSNQMKETGSVYIDITRPSESTFNTGSAINKIFHPGGGGLRDLPPLDTSMVTQTSGAGWIILGGGADWATAPPFSYQFRYRRLKDEACKAINKKLTGSETIPTATSGPADSASCPDCVGKPMLCVFSQSNNFNIFYFLL